MTDQENNVTLIWAHTPQRWLAFRHIGMAGIDFGVKRDLSDMSEDDVAATLQELGLSSQVISEFNRLLHHTEIGSWIVSSIPKSEGWANRKWIIGSERWLEAINIAPICTMTTILFKVGHPRLHRGRNNADDSRQPFGPPLGGESTQRRRVLS